MKAEVPGALVSYTGPQALLISSRGYLTHHLPMLAFYSQFGQRRTKLLLGSLKTLI